MLVEGAWGRRQKMQHRLLGKGVLLLFAMGCVFAPPEAVWGAAGPHGTVDLIAEQASLQPSLPFWVGLHFRLEPGWHIYWTNPGDSGEPPRVKWNLPAGFQAGPLKWPLPRRIEDHTLIDYGYQNEVLIPAEIMPPASLPERPDVQLQATVNWLVCREACIPARANLELVLPTQKGTAGQASPMHSLFAKARADLPRPPPPSWKIRASLDNQNFVLNVETGKRETNATFFPLDPNQIENAAPQKASSLPRGIRIELRKSDQLLKSPPSLAGVLVLGAGQGYTIEAPITQSKPIRAL